MKTRISVFVLAFGSWALMACKNAEGVEMSKAERQAIATAEILIAKKYPDFDKAKMRIVIRSMGDHWEVSYELPSDMLGGAPVVLIDKRTGVVIRSFRTQ